MKKFKLNKQKLNLKTLTTPLLALSLVLGLALNLSLSGRASAASVTTTDYPISTESGGLGYTDVISTDYPLNLTSLEPGGSFWKVGPDSNYSSPGGRRFETFNFSNLESCNQTSNIDAINYKFSIKIIGSSSVNDESWILLYNPSDSNNPIVEITELPASNASSNFVQYDFNFPVLPTTFANINDYKIAIMYDNMDATASRMEFDVDEISRTLTYDDSSCPSTNTTPTITSPSAVTIPSTTTSGSTVVPGSSLAAADTDGDALTYSITAGNANSYFAIDSATGNITTASANIPAGTYTITVQVDDGNGGTATADVTITVTTSTTPALYCPSPYSITTLLTPSGDCDEDGITNQTEGFDPDGDGNPSTGTAPIDTDGDGKPDYLDLDSDNDGILDTEEKGTLANSSTNPSDVDSDGTPDFRDLDSDNDSTKDVLESGRNNLDTNNDGRIDGTTNTYGIPSSAASTTNPKALASTSLKDSDNNGTPDYRQSSRNAVSVLAKTGQSTITALALATLSLVGAVLAKARRVRV